MNFHGWELLKLLAAYALALPIGWERERDERSAGIRTYPLVALGSCAYVLLATRFLQSPEANARVIQGLVQAVGFLGAGAIIQQGATIHGTATAASIFAMGAIGAAVAFGYWDGAVFLSLVVLATLRLLAPLKKEKNGK